MDKSKLLEGLKKIKEAFGTAEKFVDAKLVDGVTVVRYKEDVLAIGVPVMVITESGEMPIPDGDYELIDGTKMTTINGLVSNVEMMEEPTDPTMPVDATQAPAPASEMNEAKAKSIIESVIREQRFVTEEMLTEALTKVTSTKETFAKDEVKGLKEQVTKQESVIKLMFELIEKLADEPTVTKTEKTKKAFSVSDWKKEYKQDLQKIQDNINN